MVGVIATETLRLQETAIANVSTCISFCLAGDMFGEGVFDDVLEEFALKDIGGEVGGNVSFQVGPSFIFKVAEWTFHHGFDQDFRFLLILLLFLLLLFLLLGLLLLLLLLVQPLMLLEDRQPVDGIAADFAHVLPVWRGAVEGHVMIQRHFRRRLERTVGT